jgi:hypothetical protein
MSVQEFFGYLLRDERSRTLALALVDVYGERTRKAAARAE